MVPASHFVSYDTDQLQGNIWMRLKCVRNACRTHAKYMQDECKMLTRCVCASAKSRDKAAARRTVQLSSKVTFEYVWNAFKTCLKRVQDTSGMHARRVRASAQPCDKATARRTWVPCPFFSRRGCIQNACCTRPECMRDTSETHANVTLELSLRFTMCNSYQSLNSVKILRVTIQMLKWVSCQKPKCFSDFIISLPCWFLSFAS